MWTESLGCVTDINGIWSQAISESANRTQVHETILQRKADLPTGDGSCALAMHQHAGEQIDVEVFEIDVLERHETQCGEKLLPHHNSEQPSHGLVSSLVVVCGKGI